MKIATGGEDDLIDSNKEKLKKGIPTMFMIPNLL